jgi:hypothetical protein
MACDTQYTREGQTLTERKEEIRTTVAKLSADLAAGRVKIAVGPQGAIAFDGWQNRAGITDACAYRRIMATGSALAKAKIQAAELLSGRSVNKQTVANGVHSHDGGKTWGTHGHKH